MTVLDLNKKCRLVQRNIDRCERRKENRKTRKQFLKNPYEVTKKMFTEATSGTRKCTKQKLDDHIKETYSDTKRDEILPPMEGSKRPTKPGIKFDLGDIKKKEVDVFVKKARAKSAPGRDGLSYKVNKYCEHLIQKSFLLLRELWQKGEIVDEWCKAERMFLPKEAEADLIGQFMEFLQA